MSKIVGLVYVSRDFPSNWKKLYDIPSANILTRRVWIRLLS